MRTTLEFLACEEKLGHSVSLRTPSDNKLVYGNDHDADIYCIHSQIHPTAIHDDKPKFLFCHGEPLSSIGNGISMRAIVDLASCVDAFICMRRDEYPVWKSIKRSTYLVPKGVDLEVYRPAPPDKKLPGEPAVLYCENWRGERNPLMICVAMEQVWKRFPGAVLHLYNVQNQKMLDTFLALWRHCHWASWIGSIKGPETDVVGLYNRCDIVASCLFPLYARTPPEALACGKGVVAPGYRDTPYPYQCELNADSMADAIIRMWSEWGKFDFRAHAAKHHDAMESTRQAIAIYERYA